MTDYTDIIRIQFTKFGYKPRAKQVEIINEILNIFIDKNKHHVVLSASTGVGKSLIALIATECLSYILEKAPDAYVVMHTNSLVNQYMKSYGDKFDILRVMGKGNYKCTLMGETAECCVYDKKAKYPFLKKLISLHCSKCEYMMLKNKMEECEYFCTNYAYFFTNSFLAEKSRLLTIYDEAQTLNDNFVDKYKVEINQRMIDYFIEEIKNYGLNDATTNLKTFGKTIKNKEITEDNFVDFFKCVDETYSLIMDRLIDICHDALENKDFSTYSETYRIFDKYGKLRQRIAFMIENNYERVIDIRDDAIDVLPIFIKEMFKLIKHSKYHLFMSATIDKEYMVTTFSIPEDDVEFIVGGNIFPPENKEIVFCNVGHFNYKNMNDEIYFKEVCSVVNTLIRDHNDEKGIVLTTSFKMNTAITNELDSFIRKNKINIKIFSQTENVVLRELISEFKEYEKPSVLISPSIFEGLDLPDDESRFQIFVKAPYYNLGDKRIDYILKNYPIIYRKIALYRMIQGAGRSVRSPEDYCTNYFLDMNLNRLFQAKDNYWKNEFSVINL